MDDVIETADWADVPAARLFERYRESREAPVF